MKLSALKELAEKATPGKWECHDLGPTLLEMPKVKPIQIPRWSDAEFIAAANPQVVLQLIDRIEELTEALEEISDTQNIYTEALSKYGADVELK